MLSSLQYSKIEKYVRYHTELAMYHSETTTENKFSEELVAEDWIINVHEIGDEIGVEITDETMVEVQVTCFGEGTDFASAKINGIDIADKLSKDLKRTLLDKVLLVLATQYEGKVIMV